jgi:hypothetical protein
MNPTAQMFLQAQGITSVATVMATNTNELAPAWVEWNEGAFNTLRAAADIECWKRDLEPHLSSESTKMGANPLSNHDAGAELTQKPVAEVVSPTVEVAPELRDLESEARKFLSAQGIATAKGFSVN